MSYKRDVQESNDFWKDQQAKAAEAFEYEKQTRPPMLRAKLRKLLADTNDAHNSGNAARVRELQQQVLSIRNELKKYQTS